jgi:transposase InsO family protein
VTTDSNRNETISPNYLERQFEANAPNQAWKADITYIWTLEGWLYLTIVIDLFSRQVMGLALLQATCRIRRTSVSYKWLFSAGNRNQAYPIIWIDATNMPAMNTVDISPS